MLLYLVRHGKAEAGDDDAARRLTGEGRESVRRVARRLAKAGVRVDTIEHSGLARARETAGLLARRLGGAVENASDLGPMDDVALTAERLVESGGPDLMLVGHLPFMERMAAYLLAGDPDAQMLHFRAAAVCCLSSSGARWTLEWFLSPELA